METLVSGKRKVKIGNDRARFYKAPRLVSLIPGVTLESAVTHRNSLNLPDRSTDDDEGVTITAANREKWQR